MVLAAPGPLLTPPPSSSPPKTPHRSYSAQTRSQNEEKNLPPKPYLPLQIRTRHRQSQDAGYPSHNALPTPPIMSDRKPTQPTTRHSRRGRTGRERPDVEADVDEGGLRLQAATDRSACVAAPHRTSHPPQQKDAVHSCAPARGRWPAPAQDRCAAPHGRI
jgi:hypothetical protein